MQGQYQLGQIYQKITGHRNPVGSFLQRNSMPHFQPDPPDHDPRNITEPYKQTKKRQSLDIDQTPAKHTSNQPAQGAPKNERFHRPCHSLLLQQIRAKDQKRTGKQIQLQKSWMHQYDRKKDSQNRLNPQRNHTFDEVIDTYEQSLEEEIRKAKRQELRKHSILPQLKAKEVKTIKESITTLPKTYTFEKEPNAQHKIRSSHLISKRYTEGPEVIAARSRKQRIFLQKKNNQEKKIQQQLVKYHKETKIYCEYIAKKYSLVPALTQKKYLKKKPKKQNEKQKQNIEDDDQLETKIDKESSKFSELLDEVVRLNLGLKNKQEELQLLERVIDVNAFNQYIHRQQGRMQEIEEQSMYESREYKQESLENTEDNGEKWQVSGHHARINDPAFNFILHPHRLYSQPQTNRNHQANVQPPQNNRIHINERLKSLLF